MPGTGDHELPIWPGLKNSGKYLVGPRLRLSALRCHLLRRGHDATPPVLPDLCLAGPPRGPADAPPPASRAPAVVTIAAPSVSYTHLTLPTKA